MTGEESVHNKSPQMDAEMLTSFAFISAIGLSRYA